MIESSEKGVKVKWKTESGKYNRKLYSRICYMCNEEAFLPKSKLRKICRQCAYTVNAFKINSYITRPERGLDGRYTKKLH